MRTALVGDDFAVLVSFERDGEPFVPDAGSLTYSLRGQDGLQLIAATDLADITDTRVTITIPATHQTVASDKRFEKRTLIVQGTIDSQPFQVVTPYRITAWLNHTATPDQVRTFVGLDAGELPDGDIDLVTAYLTLADQIGDAELVAGLSTGDATEQLCNEAIVARAVLDIFPSLPLRISKKESDGNRQVERFALQLDEIRAAATAAIDKAATALSSSVGTLSPALIAITNRVDPFTGA